MFLSQTYYDQIVTNDRDRMLLSYTRTFFESDKKPTPYDIKRSKKKAAAIKELNENVQQYLYNV